MEINAFIDMLFAEAECLGIKEYQVNYTEEEETEIRVFDQKISLQSAAETRVLKFSVLIDDKIGCLTTECFEAEEAAFIVQEAAANARLMDCDEKFFFYGGGGIYKEVKPYCPLSDKLQELNVVEYLKEAERLAYETDKRIHQVTFVRYFQNSHRRIIRNCKGLNVQYSARFANAYIELAAKDDKGLKSYGYSVSFDKDEDFDPAYVANRAAVKVLSHLNAVDVKSQKTAVIFENRRFAEFLKAIKSIFDAYFVETGQSQLKGKVGKQIASEKLTLVDDPWLEGGFGTVPFDGEGVPSQYKDVIKNGVLKTFLYGLCMADKHKCKTTGNGTGSQAAQTFNFYIENGKLSPEELLKELGNGVYIDKIIGLAPAVNWVTGDVSAAAEGYLVQDGKLGKALNQFTFSCNLYQLLKDIREIGNDLSFYCSPVGSPSVLVDNITVASV